MSIPQSIEPPPCTSPCQTVCTCDITHPLTTQQGLLLFPFYRQGHKCFPRVPQLVTVRAQGLRAQMAHVRAGGRADGCNQIQTFLCNGAVGSGWLFRTGPLHTPMCFPLHHALPVLANNSLEVYPACPRSQGSPVCVSHRRPRSSTVQTLLSKQSQSSFCVRGQGWAQCGLCCVSHIEALCWGSPQAV